MIKLLAIELIRHLLRGRMFVHEQFAIGQVGIELGDVGLGVGDVGCRAKVVGVVVEDVLVRGVGRHVAVPRLHIVGVFGLVPLHERTKRRARYGIALGTSCVPRERCSKLTVWGLPAARNYIPI